MRLVLRQRVQITHQLRIRGALQRERDVEAVLRHTQDALIRCGLREPRLQRMLQGLTAAETKEGPEPHTSDIRHDRCPFTIDSHIRRFSRQLRVPDAIAEVVARLELAAIDHLATGGNITGTVDEIGNLKRCRRRLLVSFGCGCKRLALGRRVRSWQRRKLLGHRRGILQRKLQHRISTYGRILRRRRLLRVRRRNHPSDQRR